MKNLILFCLCCFFFSSCNEKLVPGEKEVLLNVLVVNHNGEPKAKEKIGFLSSKKGKTLWKKTDSNGKFSVLLSKGDTFDITVKNLDLTMNKLITPDSAGLYTYNLTITIELINKIITLRNVYFDFNEANLKKNSYSELDDIAALMRENKNMEIEISGHTDDVGTPEYNMQLSHDRAKSVMFYLIDKGIAQNRITTKGYGNTIPVAENSTEEGKQQNRRTEIRITRE